MPCTTIDMVVEKQEDIYELKRIEARLLKNTKLLELCELNNLQNYKKELLQQRQELNKSRYKIELKYAAKPSRGCEEILETVIKKQWDILAIEYYDIKTLLNTMRIKQCDEKGLKKAKNIFKERISEALTSKFNIERKVNKY